MKELLPSDKQHYATELGYYLTASIGNYTRIDYGTGHEAGNRDIYRTTHIYIIYL